MRTLLETMLLYYEGEIDTLYDVPPPSEGLPDAERFFEVCKALQSDWRALIVDGGYYTTPEGLDVWWMLAFGHTYAAFPELDSYYRWEGNDEQKPIDKANAIENHFYEQEHLRHLLANRFGRE